MQEQPAPAKAEAPKDKDAPAPSMEGVSQPGKDEKQTMIPGMGDPAPAGKVVNFTAAREGAAKGKPPEQAAAPNKANPQPRDKMPQSKPPAGKDAPATAEAPAATEQPPAPWDATRGVKEKIVYLNLSELHPFKNVRDDAEMQGLVDEEAAEVVRRIFSLTMEGYGPYQISKLLSEAKVEFPLSIWHAFTKE